MILYDWRDHEEQPLQERFGGIENLASDWLTIQLENVPRGLWVPPTQRPTLPDESRPRLFVSHRQHDAECARRVAWLADQVGFDVWLDVMDPTLNRATKPIDIATIIETALLNSTHVSVVMTLRTHGSQWVPYEYGRVKDGVTLTDQAMCCRSPRVPAGGLPKYMHLGPIESDERGLTTWLEAEFTKWTGDKPSLTGDWIPPTPYPEPEPLWTRCHAADDARAGKSAGP